MISIIVPMYNEEELVDKCINEIRDVMDALKTKWELIVVNDGSKDGTLQKLINYKKRMPNLVIISKKKNEGPGAAFRSGFNAAKGGIIITNDSDNSISPKYIPKMIAAIKKADVVVGSQYVKRGCIKNVPLKRVIISRIANFLDRIILGINLTSFSTFFVAYRKKAIKSIDFKADGFDAQCEILVKLHRKCYKIKEVPCVLAWSETRKRVSSINISREIKNRLLLWYRLKRTV